MAIPKKKADRLIYLKMLLLVFGTVSFLVGAAIGSFWYVFGDKTALKRFLNFDTDKKTVAGDKVYRNPRLELDGLIRAKIFNANREQ
jgi:hypothetical protein